MCGEGVRATGKTAVRQHNITGNRWVKEAHAGNVPECCLQRRLGPFVCARQVIGDDSCIRRIA